MGWVQDAGLAGPLSCEWSQGLSSAPGLPLWDHHSSRSRGAPLVEPVARSSKAWSPRTGGSAGDGFVVTLGVLASYRCPNKFPQT